MLSNHERELIAAGRTCQYCGKPTTLSCSQCGRSLCTPHAACNLTTMIHIVGLPCQPSAVRAVPVPCPTCGHVPAAHLAGSAERCGVCPDNRCQPQRDPTDPWGQPIIQEHP